MIFFISITIIKFSVISDFYFSHTTFLRSTPWDFFFLNYYPIIITFRLLFLLHQREGQTLFFFLFFQLLLSDFINFRLLFLPHPREAHNLRFFFLKIIINFAVISDFYSSYTTNEMSTHWSFFFWNFYPIIITCRLLFLRHQRESQTLWFFFFSITIIQFSLISDFFFSYTNLTSIPYFFFFKILIQFSLLSQLFFLLYLNEAQNLAIVV